MEEINPKELGGLYRTPEMAKSLMDSMSGLTRRIGTERFTLLQLAHSVGKKVEDFLDARVLQQLKDYDSKFLEFNILIDHEMYGAAENMLDGLLAEGESLIGILKIEIQRLSLSHGKISSRPTPEKSDSSHIN